MKKILVFICALSLGGCAFTEQQVTLQYDPQQGVTPISGAENVVVSVQANDLRQDKSKVSSKKNGFGIETAAIVPTEDISMTVRKAIEQELRARGFKLSDNANVHIAADVTRFYNDFKTGLLSGDAVADLNMLVTVKSSQGQMLYSRQIIVQGAEQNIMLANGNNAKIALDRALESGLKTLLTDSNFLSALMLAAQQKAG